MVALLLSTEAAVAERRGDRRAAAMRLERTTEFDPDPTWNCELACVYRDDDRHEQAANQFRIALVKLGPHTNPELVGRLERALASCERRARASAPPQALASNADRPRIVLAVTSLTISLCLNGLMLARYWRVARRDVKYAELVVVIVDGLLQRQLLDLLRAEGVEPTRGDRVLQRLDDGMKAVFAASVLLALGTIVMAG